VQVTDSQNRTASKSFALRVNAPELTIVTTSLPPGAVATAYSQQLVATGGTLPRTWSGLDLPPGLTVSPQGVVNGTPTAAGSFRINALVTDADGKQVGGYVTIRITDTPLTITTASPLPAARLNTAYSQSFAASGGLGPYTFTLAGGSLPAGLSFANGAITGTTTAVGTSEFTIRVTDSIQGTVTKLFSLAVVGTGPTITTTSISSATVNLPYTQGLSATGGTQPYTWSLASGSLPAGISLNATTGELSGSPTATGSFDFVARVTDRNQLTNDRAFALRVVAALSITTTSLGNFTVGTPVNTSVAATGGTTPYSFSVANGSLPAGLNLAQNGAIAGTPTAAGPYSFTAQVMDAGGLTATRQFSGNVTASGPVLIITTTTLPSGTAGTAYSANLTASGNVGVVNWEVANGNLPPGLSLGQSTGILSGTPTANGSFPFTIRASTASQSPVTQQFTIQVDLPAAPPVQITGVPPTAPPNQQPTLTVALASPFPVDVDGTTVLTFQPNAINNADDQTIQFSSGGRTSTFRVPAGTTGAIFTGGSPAIQTGTTAGMITLTTTLRTIGGGAVPGAPSTMNIQIARSAPVIQSVRVTRNANGFDVLVNGFSPTRELTQATFRFAGTSSLATGEVIVPVTTQFTNWFQNTTSAQFGSQFLLTQPFIINGQSSAVNSVTVILTNSVGPSQSVTTSF
jgi:hypothetical protein